MSYLRWLVLAMAVNLLVVVLKDGPARVCVFSHRRNKRDSISLFEVSGIFSYDNRQCTLEFDGPFGKLARGSAGKIWRASE